jgi:hypothetical protein
VVVLELVLFDYHGMHVCINSISAERADAAAKNLPILFAESTLNFGKCKCNFYTNIEVIW